MNTSNERQNPYDWQMPVQDPNIFAGREEELSLVEEELTRLTAAKASMPTVAVMGERKVGKTSLLLRVTEMCRRREMLPVLVSLEEKFAGDTWEFWNEVLSRVMIVAADSGISVPGVKEAPIGFKLPSQGDTDDKRGVVGKLWFLGAYGLHLGGPGGAGVPSYIVEHDLKVLTQAIVGAGYKGAVLMLDEAHLLAAVRDVREQIRHTVEKAGRIGLVFAGQSALGGMFTDPLEPFYAHGRVISLGNFTDLDDVAACALLPLNREEAELMSPMTVGYLARLSQGKPNQVRLICQGALALGRTSDLI